MHSLQLPLWLLSSRHLLEFCSWDSHVTEGGSALCHSRPDYLVTTTCIFGGGWWCARIVAWVFGQLVRPIPDWYLILGIATPLLSPSNHTYSFLSHTWAETTFDTSIQLNKNKNQNTERLHILNRLIIISAQPAWVVVSLCIHAWLLYATSLLEKSQHLGGFAPASCSMGIQVYASIHVDCSSRPSNVSTWQQRAWFARTALNRRAIATD